MIKSKDRDFELAYKLHQQENCIGLTENAILPANVSLYYSGFIQI